MGVRKIYQAIEFKDLDTYEMVDGKKTLIQFRGQGSSLTAKGLYTTTNPKIIEAMDHSTSMNITFKCIHTEKFDDGEEPEPLPKRAPAAPRVTDDDIIPEGDDEDPEFTDIPDITTVQAARSYLAGDPYKIPISKIPNAAAVKAKAAELKIRFVDLV